MTEWMMEAPGVMAVDVPVLPGPSFESHSLKQALVA